MPEKIKIVWRETNYTIRKDITPDLVIKKVIDTGVKKILQNRLNEYDGDAKKAFVNLDKNPIWLNKEKGISIKRVTISGVNNVETLHYKKDHNGKYILDAEGNKQPVDFVSTGNNHHVAIYKDSMGNLQQEVVSFFEAVQRANLNLPIIDKHKEGLEFLYTIKQNEYFIFPPEDFNLEEIDLLNPDNASLISPYLYRVQKIAFSSFWFRHHLETNVDNNKELKDIAYKVIQSTNKLKAVLKVRINHLGQIVKVGEY
jgi:CRISPR-associated endonuclease Csn1